MKTNTCTPHCGNPPNSCKYCEFLLCIIFSLILKLLMFPRKLKKKISGKDKSPIKKIIKKQKR